MSPGRACVGWASAHHRRIGGLKPTLLVLFVLVLTFATHAQTTQPSSVYDGQPIKRKAPATDTPKAEQKPGFDWQRLAMALAIVMGLIFGLKYIVGRLYPSVSANKGGKAVRVLARSPIAPKQQVLLLQVGKRVIVVADSAGQLSTLSQIDDADEIASLVGQIDNIDVPAPRTRFGNMFRRAQEEYVEPVPDLASEPVEQAEPSQDIAEAQSEISGLIERMRTLTKTVRRTD